jgi:DNA invertase Pin-like site-specific DNA recombinase
VGQLGGTVVGWYGGQEHATPGWEKSEVDRLIADAAKGKFDAVIVAYADRWSRDNAKSKEGLEAFRKHGIRFFVGTMPMDLFDPQVRFILGMNAEVGEFIALQQIKKSLESKIQRAREGRPACGRLPFGRTFDTAKGRWIVDSNKRALVEDAARRYLAGEPLKKLAQEHGMGRGYLYTVLTDRCGPVWEQEFISQALNIHEVIRTPVPPLLPEETILAVCQHAANNRCYHHIKGQHRQTRHSYLLGGMVFCEHCGHALTGQVAPTKHNRYYRHARQDCAAGAGWVNADDLEDAVLRDLFDLFGNPVAVQRAVEAATPDIGKVHANREHQGRLRAQLEGIGKSRDRVIAFIARDTISERDAEKQLGELAQKEHALREELGRLIVELENVATPEEIEAAAEQAVATFKRRPCVDAELMFATISTNHDFDAMSWDEARKLVELVFAGRTPDGKRRGVYVGRPEGRGGTRHKRHVFRMLGRLLDQWGKTPKPPFTPKDPKISTDGTIWTDQEFDGGPLQGLLLKDVNKEAVTIDSSSPQRGCRRGSSSAAGGRCR